MTASKSSRARNARAQANAARSRDAAGSRGNGSGPAAKPGTTVAVRTGGGRGDGAAVKSGDGDGAGRGRVASARNGGTTRGGPRAQVTWEEPAGATSATGTAVPVWLQLTTFVLALAGLGVSIYLTIAHFSQSALFACAESGVVNCTKVTTSPQSYVFGIPVAVLGLAFFVAAVALMSPWAWRSARREVHLIRLASVVIGVGFVLYLIYAELIIIGSICLYCTSVHVITFVLFALTAFAAAVWGLDPARPR
ncbi:MAG TPA: vitamin K epoxide reductase family protein [Streptosporangiaceae bacterium]|nr:vitamin K epoxide reductase family protein [Streptosporangiaceae bacterium]